MLQRCVLYSKINIYKLSWKTSRCYWLILRNISQLSLTDTVPKYKEGKKRIAEDMNGGSSRMQTGALLKNFRLKANQKHKLVVTKRSFRSSVVVQWKRIWLGTMRLPVWSLASLSGLRIRCCCELWCRSKTWLRSWVSAGSCSSDSTPSLGTSICLGCGPKKKKGRH